MPHPYVTFMTWFLFAVLANVIWSACNHLDKYLLSHRGGRIGTQIILSSFFGICIIIPILLFYPEALNAAMQARVVGIFAGCIAMLGILLYLYALEQEEATLVVPWFQFVPIIAYCYGLFMLSETLSLTQIVGVLFVVLGATGISFDIDSRIPRIKIRPVLLMIGAATLLAGTVTLFKYVASLTDYWTANFWSTIGEVGMGFFFLCIAPYRRQLFFVFKQRLWRSFGINALNEILNIIASLLFRVSLTLAPVALVTAVTGLQPVLVFILGIGITIFLPHMSQERITRKHLAYRSLFLIITLVGTVFLNL